MAPSSRLGHWWLIFNHYKFSHFCFPSYLYWVEPLLYLERKVSFLAFPESLFFSSPTWKIKHQASILCKQHGVHLKCSQITTTHGAAHFTALLAIKYNQLNNQKQHHQITFLKFFNSMQMVSATNQMKCNYSSKIRVQK